MAEEINININPQSYQDTISEKSRLTATLLAWLLGGLGVHRFYVGKVTSGIMQILFGWATGFIWNLIDAIVITSGVFKDIEGKIIRKW